MEIFDPGAYTPAKDGSRFLDPVPGKAKASSSDITFEGARLEGFDGELDPRDVNGLLTIPPVVVPPGEETILGFDTRAQLTPSAYPARAAVLVVFGMGSGQGRCSGAMIGSDTVATAGHCLHSGGASGRWYEDVTVYPGYDGTVAPFGSCGAVELLSTTGWVQNNKAEFDYGAIKLDCSIGNVTGWFGIRSGPVKGRPSIITGYPGDKPLELWQSADKIRAAGGKVVRYANDTYGGMSGSPVWEDWWDENQSKGPYLIGVHTRGTLSGGFNLGTRINQAVFDNFVTWINLPPPPPPS